MHITTEDFPPNLTNDKAVIIMNHRTRLDWLYYWSVILRQGKLENEKIILKQELKHIPGAGMFTIYDVIFYLMNQVNGWILIT